MHYRDSMVVFDVTCRIGSLENAGDVRSEFTIVTCRIGSLENQVADNRIRMDVTCRIGSLEILPI